MASSRDDAAPDCPECGNNVLVSGAKSTKHKWRCFGCGSKWGGEKLYVP